LKEKKKKKDRTRTRAGGGGFLKNSLGRGPLTRRSVRKFGEKGKGVEKGREMRGKKKYTGGKEDRRPR